MKTAVEQLYGDDKDDIWKRSGNQTFKEELGIGEVEEPGVHLEAGGFKVNTGGDGLNDSKIGEKIWEVSRKRYESILAIGKEQVPFGVYAIEKDGRSTNTS